MKFLYFALFVTFFLLGFFNAQSLELEGGPAWRKEMLIIGTPHSGLKEAIELLHLPMFLDKPIKKLGLASWGALFDPPPGERRPIPIEITFEHTYHIVRHPFYVIKELNKERGKSLKQWERLIKACVPEIKPEDRGIVLYAKVWLYFNLLAEKKAEQTFRFEELAEFAHHLEIPPPITEGSFYPTKVSWPLLEEILDYELFIQVKELAAKYGYSTE